MAKFIKFNIQNSGNGLNATSGFRYVDVKDIESVTDVIGGGPGYAVQVVLKGLASFAPGHADGAAVPADTIGGRVLIRGGSASGTTSGAGGAVTIESGSSASASAGGVISITSGVSATGISGGISMESGVSSTVASSPKNKVSVVPI